jgi:hypothetical protein
MTDSKTSRERVGRDVGTGATTDTRTSTCRPGKQHPLRVTRFESGRRRGSDNGREDKPLTSQKGRRRGSDNGHEDEHVRPGK